MPAAANKTLENLFYDHLKDIYYAEKQIVKTLPKMMKAAQSAKLKKAFEKHLHETEGQIDRLEQVFELCGKKAQGKTCEAIDGILKEGAEVLEDYKDTQAIDAGLIAAAQAVEHYEITRYGTLKRWATLLDMADAARLLDETLQQEAQTDEDLTDIADDQANETAMGSMGKAA